MTAGQKAAVIAAAVLVLAAHTHPASRPGKTVLTSDRTRSGPASPGGNAALGKRMAAADGWTGAQWTCLDELWTRESGWRATVWNEQGSGAYGIPQSLPAGKMAAAGAGYMTDPVTQIRWGLRYIAGRYGTPCNAWSFELANGGY